MDQIAVRQCIIQHMNAVVEDLKKSPQLDLVSGNTTREKWKAFASQRLLAPTVFARLLETGMAFAAECGHTNIQIALRQNWQDETGQQKDGSVDASAAHATWREDFSKAIDLPKSVTQATGAAAYQKEMEAALASKKPFVVYGVLLGLERIIPVEFGFVKEGMDRLFAGEFASPASRRYIEDHIIHDAQDHFPDLLDAIVKDMTDDQEFNDLTHGIDVATRAKGSFYKDPGVFGLPKDMSKIAEWTRNFINRYREALEALADK